MELAEVAQSVGHEVHLPAAILNMRQEAGGLSAFGQTAGKTRRNQPIPGPATSVYSGKRSILRIADLPVLALTSAQDKVILIVHYAKRSLAAVL